MTQTTTGRLIGIAALGMMAGLLAPEVSGLATWDMVLDTQFVGKVLGHFAAVIAAFVGGRLIPTKGE